MISIKTQNAQKKQISQPILGYLYLVVIIFIFSGLTSCYTIVKTVKIETIQEADLTQLESLEIALIEYRLTKQSALLKKSEVLIKDIEKKETVNKPFKAKLLALKAEMLVLKNKEKKNPNSPAFKKKMKELLNQVSLNNPREERIFIVQALMSNSSYTQKDYLTRGSQRPGASRCFMELGLLYFETGDYREATSFLDQASMKLPLSYEKLYIKTRDKAFRLAKGRNNGKKRGDMNLLFVKDKLTLMEGITILHTKSSLLKGIAGDRTSEEVIELLKKNGYINKNNIKNDDFLPRKELANILAWLIAQKENDLNLLADSGDYYRDNKLGSPIGDVPVKNNFFNPIVVVLEAEIMNLPDGEKFFPNRAVSGSDMEECLKRLRRTYK